MLDCKFNVGDEVRLKVLDKRGVVIHREFGVTVNSHSNEYQVLFQGTHELQLITIPEGALQGKDN